MLDANALIAKFGDWSRPYADAVVPALLQYGIEGNRLSLRRGGDDEGAIVTIRAGPAPAVPHCMMDPAKINELRSEHGAFRRQCIEMIVWPKRRMVEYTFADVDTTTSAQIEAKHFSCAWNPDKELTVVLTPAVAAQRESIDRDMSRNSRLCSADARRIRHAVSLYLVSSAEVPAFRVYIEDSGSTLVFVGVRRLSLSWCMHVIRQADIGVNRIQVTDTDIQFTMVPAITENASSPLRGGPVRARGTSVTSFVNKIRRGISSIL